MRTLYVGGLPHETDNEVLRELFSSYGTVEEARVVMRPGTTKCRGFGYVTFTDAQAAERALSDINSPRPREADDRAPDVPGVPGLRVDYAR